MNQEEKERVIGDVIAVLKEAPEAVVRYADLEKVMRLINTLWDVVFDIGEELAAKRNEKPMKPREFVPLAEEAYKAAEAVKDTELRHVAFLKILDHLLTEYPNGVPDPETPSEIKFVEAEK